MQKRKYDHQILGKGTEKHVIQIVKSSLINQICAPASMTVEIALTL